MYVPSQKLLDKILISLSVTSGNELALPGNWSPTIFVDDLTLYPVDTKNTLCKNMMSAITEKWTYLEFFEKSRGYPRYHSSAQWWKIFDNGQLMMLAEPLFLKLISGKITESYPNFITEAEFNNDLQSYLTTMGNEHMNKWDGIVNGTGACCWQFFLENPTDYIFLLHRSKANVVMKTDFEMLAELGNISCQSRAELVKIFENKFGQK